MINAETAQWILESTNQSDFDAKKCFNNVFRNADFIWNKITFSDRALAFDVCIYVCKNQGLNSLNFIWSDNIVEFSPLALLSICLEQNCFQNCFDWKRVYCRSRWANKCGEKTKLTWIFKSTEVVGRSSVSRKTFRIWFSDVKFNTSC